MAACFYAPVWEVPELEIRQTAETFWKLAGVSVLWPFEAAPAAWSFGVVALLGATGLGLAALLIGKPTQPRLRNRR